MRTYISIFFLTIFIGYQSGHSFIYWLLEKRIHHVWQEKINGGNTDTQLIVEKSFVIPSPYQTYRPDFVDSNLGIEVDGINYRMLRHRYSRDTLHVVFILDTLKENLDHLYDDLANTENKPWMSNQQKQHLMFLLFPKPVIPTDKNAFEFQKYLQLVADIKINVEEHAENQYDLEVPTPPPSFI